MKPIVRIGKRFCKSFGGWPSGNSAVGGAVLSAASGCEVSKGSKAYRGCNQYGTIRLLSVSWNKRWNGNGIIFHFFSIGRLRAHQQQRTIRRQDSRLSTSSLRSNKVRKKY